jgi:hypothetical protein
MRYMLRVNNPAEYEGRVWIETDYYEGWGVAPWDEWGLSEIYGPFESVTQAKQVLEDNKEYLEWRGWKVLV